MKDFGTASTEMVRTYMLERGFDVDVIDFDGLADAYSRRGTTSLTNDERVALYRRCSAGIGKVWERQDIRNFSVLVNSVPHPEKDPAASLLHRAFLVQILPLFLTAMTEQTEAIQDPIFRENVRYDLRRGVLLPCQPADRAFLARTAISGSLGLHAGASLTSVRPSDPADDPGKTLELITNTPSILLRLPVAFQLQWFRILLRWL